MNDRSESAWQNMNFAKGKFTPIAFHAARFKPSWQLQTNVSAQ